MNEKQAKQLAQQMLSGKRLQHTLCVKQAAVELAQQHGGDTEKAAVAALLHDIAKELSKEEMLRIFQDNDIMAGNALQKPVPVWHGICGAILAKVRWGITDNEILDAIMFHTTGRPQMTALDKIIFLADKSGADRNYPEAERLRKLARQDLDKAMLEAMETNVAWMKEKNQTIDDLSLQTLQFLRHKHNEGDSVV